MLLQTTYPRKRHYDRAFCQPQPMQPTQENEVKVAKLGAKSITRFLSLADDYFLNDVNEDIKEFLTNNDIGSILLFPPVSNHRRFLIHKCVEELERNDLKTFSIGQGDGRRTVVCFKKDILSDAGTSASATMGLRDNGSTVALNSQNIINGAHGAAGCSGGGGGGDGGGGENEVGLYRPPSERHQNKTLLVQEKIRASRPRQRRPDRAVYVPRALRGTETTQTTDDDKCITAETSQTLNENNYENKNTQIGEKASPRKTLDKTFCNVYTPPHLRQSKRSQPDSDHKRTSSDSSSRKRTIEVISDIPTNNSVKKCNSDKVTDLVDEVDCVSLVNFTSDYDIDRTFKESENCDINAEKPNSEFIINDWSKNLINMDTNETDTINTNQRSEYKAAKEDEEKEFAVTPEEINRTNRRILRARYNDVLIISDPIQSETKSADSLEENNTSPIKETIVKTKLANRPSLKREENDWDAVFDESGECLDPSLLEELTATVGKVHINKTRNNYEHYQTKGQSMLSSPNEESFAHVVEVYNFPAEFKTNDLLSVFSDYKDTGFEIKWVDDTHALVVFSSAKIAAEVMASNNPIVRTRPLHEATLESRQKAKKCAQFLQPYRQRPETCTALARRLVTGALGVRLATAGRERDEEKRIISMAREKKRQADLHKEAAWNGSLSNQEC